MKTNKQNTAPFVLSCIGGATALTLCLFSQTAFAEGVDDPTQRFQLESNVTDENSICFRLDATGALVAAPAGGACGAGFTLVTFDTDTDDWQNVADGTHQASAISFVDSNDGELINSNADTAFTGGGSKDEGAINGSGNNKWKWKDSGSQAKDDIEHAYAAAYELVDVVNGVDDVACGGADQPPCDTVIYFGMTRWDNSGSSAAGFWFFQDASIGLANNALTPPSFDCAAGSGCNFTGHHTDGDLLIISDFSTGGTISDIKVYTWECTGVGLACDTSGVLTPHALSGVASCNPITGVKNLCAIVNGTSGLTVPFGFINKSNETTLDHGESLEGGLNLRVIFGDNIPCFSTFMAETRASTSTDSTLSDLTPPVSFPLCGLGISKSCTNSNVQDDGNAVDYTYTVTVTNTGIGPLYDVIVHDTLPDGSMQDFNVVTGNTPLNSNDSEDVIVPFTTTALSATNTATASARTQPGGGGSLVTTPAPAATATCTASVQGALAVDKDCDLTAGGPILEPLGGKVVVKVPFTARVCNTGDEEITNITLTDVPTANMLSPSSPFNLGPGQCNNSITGNYYPSQISSGNGTGAGRYFFTDTITATGTGTLSQLPRTNSGGADCPICPLGYCTQTLPDSNDPAFPPASP